ncbi:hypothetical protein [Jiulongibacter sp. NS-SX5]|uniref:hypothetical protein n=1 Tax=Jiulongibacter sp. NS-SX5 TaxID=3463854 RepID=UPI004058079D
MKDLKTVLMTRDGMPEAAADELIAEMHERVLDGEDPEDILYEIGLEPDYVFDLLMSKISNNY